MGNIAKLPTAATGYYTAHKLGRYYNVLLVTPIDGMKSLKTRIYRLCEEQYAHDVARNIAAEMKRPFKVGGIVQ